MSFLNDSDRNEAKNAYKIFFDEFKENITIHKKAKVNVLNIGSTQLFGYNEPANEANYTYNVENQTFQGLVIHPKSRNQAPEFGQLNQIDATVLQGQVLIKVELDCRNYLNSGKVERIDIQGKSYNLVSEESAPYKIINNYYVFRLQETK